MSGGVTGKICSQQKHTHTHTSVCFCLGFFSSLERFFKKLKLKKIEKRG
jgi:hypothetical protein